MKITVIRKYKKVSYTIGELWIDGKYVCDVMEPVVRDAIDRPVSSFMLKGVELARFELLVKLEKAKHPRGTTAIPPGAYRVQVAVSAHFHARRAYLMDVPGFSGVMIHEGNKPGDTHGCILVGRNKVKGQLVDSRICLGEVNSRIIEAVDRNEPVVVVVR